jgi:hypothetical protein
MSLRRRPLQSVLVRNVLERAGGPLTDRLPIQNCRLTGGPSSWRPVFPMFRSVWSRTQRSQVQILSPQPLL